MLGLRGSAGAALKSYDMERVAIFSAGLFAWTLVEYAIHAWLSHTFKTFATPLHDVHHRDAHAVFTVRAWIPIALSWIAGFAIFGWGPGMIFFTGIAAGFAAYEAIHYRVHFSRPSCAAEAHLRLRHLVHHNCEPLACFGVTSELWDLIFGTELIGEPMAANCEKVANMQPLAGATNVRKIFQFGGVGR